MGGDEHFFERAALRRAIWNGLWNTAHRMTLGPNRTDDDQRGHWYAITAHTEWVAAGTYLQRDNFIRARAKVRLARINWDGVM